MNAVGRGWRAPTGRRRPGPGCIAVLIALGGSALHASNAHALPQVATLLKEKLSTVKAELKLPKVDLKLPSGRLRRRVGNVFKELVAVPTQIPNLHDRARDGLTIWRGFERVAAASTVPWLLLGMGLGGEQAMTTKNLFAVAFAPATIGTLVEGFIGIHFEKDGSSPQAKTPLHSFIRGLYAPLPIVATSVGVIAPAIGVHVDPAAAAITFAATSLSSATLRAIAKAKRNRRLVEETWKP